MWKFFLYTQQIHYFISKIMKREVIIKIIEFSSDGVKNNTDKIRISFRLLVFGMLPFRHAAGLFCYAKRVLCYNLFASWSQTQMMKSSQTNRCYCRNETTACSGDIIDAFSEENISSTNYTYKVRSTWVNSFLSPNSNDSHTVLMLKLSWPSEILSFQSDY